MSLSSILFISSKPRMSAGLSLSFFAVKEVAKRDPLAKLLDCGFTLT